MDINLKCEILKSKSSEFLVKIKEEQKLQQQEYEKLIKQRHRGIDVEDQIKRNVSNNAYLHNKILEYKDIIELIDFLQDESRMEFRRIDLKE